MTEKKRDYTFVHTWGRMRKSCTVTRLQTELFGVRFPIAKHVFLSSKMCRQALPSQSRIQCLRGFPPRGQISWGVNFTNHFRIEYNWRISGCKPHAPLYVSRVVEGQFYLYLYQRNSLTSMTVVSEKNQWHCALPPGLRVIQKSDNVRKWQVWCNCRSKQVTIFKWQFEYLGV